MDMTDGMVAFDDLIEASLHRTEAVFENLDEQVDIINEDLRAYGMEYRIDEMAMLTGLGSDGMRSWSSLLSEAVMAPGVELFNVAHDRVSTLPIPAEYLASYGFLRHADRDYRVEVMCIPQGHSPLHAAMWDQGPGMPIVVHASFKCTDERDLDSATVSLENVGFTLAQDCHSDYGHFRYMSKPQSNQGGYFIYLKPRINTRDSA